MGDESSVEALILDRTPEHDIDPTLDRIRELLDLLGSPQAAAPVVHVAGTNGKTSTTRMIDALLREFGLRTGRFTSPHLHSMRERISFDGVSIDPERFIAAYDDIAPYLELVDSRHEVHLSFFEVLTGMAFALDYQSKNNSFPDHVLLRTGVEILPARHVAKNETARLRGIDRRPGDPDRLQF